MSICITTLIENSQGEHLALKTEHGISFYIEKDGRSLLFDTGQSADFLSNAKRLGLDLDNVEYVVLSHGHYDHSGGFLPLSEKYSGFELVMGRGFFDRKFGHRNGSYEYLGNNFDLNYIKSRRIPYRFVDKNLTELFEGVYVITGFPRIYEDEVVNPRFMIRRNGGFQPDPFDDEVLVAVDTPEGIIVLLGCSHPGMKNMLSAAAEAVDRPLFAVLGGTHMVEASQDSLEKSIDYLSKKSIHAIGVSHCTGPLGMERLSQSNPAYFHNRTGTSLYVD